MVLFRGFNLKPTERTWVLLKRGTRDFYNSPLFTKSAYFYMKITGNFQRFERFLKNKTLFAKNRSTNFQLKVQLLKGKDFHAKLTCQNSMLNQLEWGEQNGPITKDTDLLLTT